jgi:hypothetical protein
MKLYDEFKSLPPAWLGAIAGAVAAGATLVPEHRLLAGALAGAGVFLLARHASKPCCAECASASSSSAQAPAPAAAATTDATDTVAMDGGDDLFGGSADILASSGAAAGGDLFADSYAAAAAPETETGCATCGGSALLATASAPSSTPALLNLESTAASPIDTTASSSIATAPVRLDSPEATFSRELETTSKTQESTAVSLASPIRLSFNARAIA